jgi:hypothetical protein
MGQSQNSYECKAICQDSIKASSQNEQTHDARMGEKVGEVING